MSDNRANLCILNDLQLFVWRLARRGFAGDASYDDGREAWLRPQTPLSEVVTDAIPADAVRNGWITPPLIRSPIRLGPPVAPLAELLGDLERDREDR